MEGEAKEQAISDLAKKYNLPSDVTAELREASGAKSLSTSDMKGTNYNIGAYIKFDL